MLIEIYAAMAQAEIEKKEKRQREGIQAMKDRGEWDEYGRPRKLSLKEFGKEYERVLRKEIAPFELMRELRLSKTTYYRYKKEYEERKATPERKTYKPKIRAPYPAPENW